ncbi:hypothetical protein OJ997_29655 [Solirubrobacter phytolaccae]|uniref:Ig-like domain-containing protein n=1 Tax=Solirubrobacter phytolaccae TaxID=1404360 RepID=A0A9X3NG85_9ACTN|nr:hypothetical protein [Solirubrobacter phytolaccae]MDA0184507.1 hypothetical protein [Solirubrobacter phytolaccae]
MRAVLLGVLTALVITLVPSAAAEAAPCPALSNVAHPFAPAYAPDVEPVDVKQYCADPGYDLTVGDQEHILAEHVRSAFVAEAGGQVACMPEVDCDFADDVDWAGAEYNFPYVTRIYFYVDPAKFPGYQNYYCSYSATVDGLTGPGNATVSDLESSCDLYTPAPTQAWTWASVKKPATARVHPWETCAPAECEDTPVRHVGTAEKLVAEEYAKPHWIANVQPWDASTYYAGSVKSTGSPGNWTVYVNVYRDQYVCEYKATVTGNEDDPTVTPGFGPQCAPAADEFCESYLTNEGQVVGMEGPLVGAPVDWMAHDGFAFSLVDANPCASEAEGEALIRSTAEYINTVRNRADFWSRANAAGARKTGGGFNFAGTSVTYKDGNDVWHLTTVSYISPANGNYADLGYYCVYTGTFEGDFDTGTYTSGGAPTCNYYANTIPGYNVWQDSEPPSSVSLPPDAEWRGMYLSRTYPWEHVWSKGEAEELALTQVAAAHWNTTNNGYYAAYNNTDNLYGIGSTKTTGRVNDWDVYVNIFMPTGPSTIWNCEYHVRVYVDPVTDTRKTTSLSSPVCADYLGADQ